MPDRARIERLVPQAGAMCLLDHVREWNAASITCTASAPGATHPLARDESVPAIVACEYAAQATAIHGALLEGGQAAKQGLLAKLMDVQLHALKFPGGGVTVHAEMLSRVAIGCLYAFDVASEGQPVASGRLMVAFGGPAS